MNEILYTANIFIEKMKDYFNENESRNMQLNYSIDNLEKKKEIQALEYLEEKGYIEITANALGFVSMKLTSYFIDNINNL